MEHNQIFELLFKDKVETKLNLEGSKITSCLQIANPSPVPPYFRAVSAPTCIYFLNRVGIAFSVNQGKTGLATVRKKS